MIVFDSKLSRKAARYFTTENDVERANILAGLTARGATYFIGDDTAGEMSVEEAYRKAFEFLAKNDNILYDPAPHVEETITTREFENMGRIAPTEQQPSLTPQQ